MKVIKEINGSGLFAQSALSAATSTYDTQGIALTSKMNKSSLEYNTNGQISGYAGSAFAGQGGGIEYSGTSPIIVNNEEHIISADTSEVSTFEIGEGLELSNNTIKVSGKQDTLIFGYTDDKISSINNSALYSQGGTGGTEYTGVNPIVVNNNEHKISASTTDVNLVTIGDGLQLENNTLSVSGGSVPEGTMTSGNLEFNMDNKITAYNGSAFAVAGGSIPENVITGTQIYADIWNPEQQYSGVFVNGNNVGVSAYNYGATSEIVSLTSLNDKINKAGWITTEDLYFSSISGTSIPLGRNIESTNYALKLSDYGEQKLEITCDPTKSIYYDVPLTTGTTNFLAILTEGELVDVEWVTTIDGKETYSGSFKVNTWDSKTYPFTVGIPNYANIAKIRFNIRPGNSGKIEINWNGYKYEKIELQEKLDFSYNSNNEISAINSSAIATGEYLPLSGGTLTGEVYSARIEPEGIFLSNNKSEYIATLLQSDLQIQSPGNVYSLTGVYETVSSNSGIWDAKQDALGIQNISAVATEAEALGKTDNILYVITGTGA